MVVTLHFLYCDAWTVELLRSLFLHFLYFRFKAFMLILCEHVPEFILEILHIISIFINFEAVPKGQIRPRLRDFISLKHIGIGIFLIGFDDTKIFRHILDIDGHSFIIDDFFMYRGDVSGFMWELDLIVVVGEEGEGSEEVLAVTTEEDDGFVLGGLLVPVGELWLVVDLELHAGANVRVVRVAVCELLVEVLLRVQHAFEILHSHLILLPIRSQINHRHIMLKLQIIHLFRIEPSKHKQPTLELICTAPHPGYNRCMRLDTDPPEDMLLSGLLLRDVDCIYDRWRVGFVEYFVDDGA